MIDFGSHDRAFEKALNDLRFIERRKKKVLQQKYQVSRYVRGEDIWIEKFEWRDVKGQE